MKKLIYNLSFIEAVTKCLNKEGFIKGEDFKEGVFVANIDDCLVLRERIKEQGYKDICNFMITKGTTEQKYRLLVVASDNELKY